RSQTPEIKTMSPSKATNALCERSPNTSSPSPTKSQSPEKAIKTQSGVNMNEKPIPRFDLNTNTTIGRDTRATTTYISPSDAIRSPTTKKLSEIKGKRFQNAKPQNLFAKTLAMQGLKKAQVQE
ncbi:uncharacterized protein A1O9_02750, partial [Exophiala aquamarina CBS 119918]